jgi:SAM-dependent methyltransferase
LGGLELRAVKVNIKQIHSEIARGFDAIAASKYRAELEDRIALLRSGAQSLVHVEIEELRDLLPGASVVHLQCSHGLDALSLLTLGASDVAGVDLSSEMIQLATELTHRLGQSARWFCADVVDPPAELRASADLVYTGKGSLPWIMDLDAWATSVQSLLKPGGRLYIFEGHPLDNLWDRESETLQLRADGFGYFDSGPRENPGFPASALRRVKTDMERPVMREQFWRPDQIMAALADAGLQHEMYREHPDLFWDQFPHWSNELRHRLPHSYSLRYRRPVDAAG